VRTFFWENLIERGCLVDEVGEATIILKCALKKQVMWILVGYRSIPPHGNEFSPSLKRGEFFGQMGHFEVTKRGFVACIN
jgi:hypothetical protein